MYYDMHVHSKFSSDSSLDMEAGILRAIQCGLSGIAFTDHLDIDYTNYEDDFHYDFNEYFDKLNMLKAKYKNEIEVLSAVEIGFQPHVIEATAQKIKDYQFDFIIGSTHLIKKRDPYYGTYFIDGISKINSYNEYLEELYGNLKLYADFEFNSMGHLDYIVRYANFADSQFYYKDHADYVDEIFKYIISKGIAFEINTSTYLKQPLDKTLLKRYKELGGELVTIGSDAHDPDRISKNFNKYLYIIKEAGFNFIYHFKNGNPISEKIV